MRRTPSHSLLSGVARSILTRHPVAALLAPVVVASGVAGFITGQVAGHLPHGLVLTPKVAHQSTGQVHGALGQRPGGQVAHQTVVRTVYVPQTGTPAAAQSNARQSGSQGSPQANNGHGAQSKGGHGKGGKHGKDGHGDGHAQKHGTSPVEAAGGHAAHGSGGQGGGAPRPLGPPHHKHG